MSDETTPDLDTMLPPPQTAPRKEHWKVRQKREREEAAKNAPPAPAKVEVPEAPVAGTAGPDVAPVGKFMSWGDFCCRVAVEAVMSPMWHQKLGHVKGQTRAEVRAAMTKDPGPFYNVIRRAYLVMSEAYGKGTSEFGE